MRLVPELFQTVRWLATQRVKYFSSRTIEKTLRINSPQFDRFFFASFVLTKVNSYNLGMLFRSKNLEKVKSEHVAV